MKDKSVYDFCRSNTDKTGKRTVHNVKVRWEDQDKQE